MISSSDDREFAPLLNHSTTTPHQVTTMTAVTSTPAFSHPKIVEKAFGLPIVSDTYSYGRNNFNNFSCTDFKGILIVTTNHSLARCRDRVVPDLVPPGLPPGLPAPSSVQPPRLAQVPGTGQAPRGRLHQSQHCQGPGALPTLPTRY